MNKSPQSRSLELQIEDGQPSDEHSECNLDLSDEVKKITVR